MASGDPTAIWRLLSFEVPIGEPEAATRERACRELAIDPGRLRSFRIVRKSLDARRRGGAHKLRFVLHIDLAVDRAFRSSALGRAQKTGRVVPAPPPYDARQERVHPTLAGRAPGSPAPRIAVVGAGPAGLFAGWILARHGIGATVLDRGSRVDRRSKDLVRFHRTRVPDPESNLLFGEGGAGTYSDGKVYTRVDDPLEVPILEELVAAGAPEALLYDGRAHIGTDRLHRLLPVLRAKFEAQGVQFLWNTRLEGFTVEARDRSRVRSLSTSAGEIPCDAVLLGVGHSARDTWSLLAERGVPFLAKPFQVGVRIEHPQELVDRAQHGLGPEARALGAAYYQLVSRPSGSLAAAHSFCMCPGGRIVASVNEPGLLCTNGMSNSSHSTRYANAAIVATVDPGTAGAGPFAGVALQRELERRFFEAGGSDYTAPGQRADDFQEGRASRMLPGSSFTFGAAPGRVDALLPPYLRDALRVAIARFDRSIPGFAGEQGILVGIETRSACPVRIPRNGGTRRAEGFANLYPVGEGAGYAGGIMSAAIDGARSALALLEHGL